MGDIWTNARNLPPVIRTIVRLAFWYAVRLLTELFSRSASSNFCVQPIASLQTSLIISFQRSVGVVSHSLLYHAVRQRPLQTFTPSVCIRWEPRRYRRGRRSFGISSAIILCLCRAFHQCSLPIDFRLFLIIKSGACWSSKAMVAAQSTPSHFVGHIPLDFCLVYVRHFVSLLSA